MSAVEIRVQQLEPMSVAQRIWRQGDSTFLTLVVKTTFSLENGGPARRVSTEPFARIGELLADTELAPRLPCAGLTLVGHARAPLGTMTRQMSVRVQILEAVEADAPPLFDKTVLVLGNRGPGDDFPDVFAEMPLVDDLAYGGRGDLENPNGVGNDEAGIEPNILPPDRSKRFVGFGAVPRARPSRRALLGKTSLGVPDAPLAIVPEGFDWRYLHVAPADQQFPFLKGREWIRLEGFSAAEPIISSKLPGIVPRARIRREGLDAGELSFHADYLSIDTEKARASLCWRAHLPIDLESIADYEAVVGLESPKTPFEWPYGWEVPIEETVEIRPSRLPRATNVLDANEIAEALSRAGLPFRAGAPVEKPPPASAPSSSPWAAEGRASPVRLLNPHEQGGMLGLGSAPLAPPTPRSAPPPPSPSQLPPPPAFVRAAREVLSAQERRESPRIKSTPPVAGFAETKSSPERTEVLARLDRRARLDGIDLTKVDLSGIDFSGRTLTRLNFTGARLARAIFTDADLTGALLENADLADADLTGANLSKANLDAANLTGAKLERAVLTATRFENARGENVVFRETTGQFTTFRGAVFSGVLFEHAKIDRADFSEATLDGASFAGAVFMGARFDGATIMKAKFDGAQLGLSWWNAVKCVDSTFRKASSQGARFDKAELTRIKMLGADLQSVSLRQSILSHVDFSQARMRNGDLDGARFEACVFTKADLAAANLRGANGDGVSFDGAWLDGADFRHVSLTGASFSDAQLKGARGESAKLPGANLLRADLTDASFRAATLKGAMLAFARIGGADLRDANLRGAHVFRVDLEKARVEGAQLEDLDRTTDPRAPAIDDTVK